MVGRTATPVYVVGSSFLVTEGGYRTVAPDFRWLAVFRHRYRVRVGSNPRSAMRSDDTTLDARQPQHRAVSQTMPQNRLRRPVPGQLPLQRRRVRKVLGGGGLRLRDGIDRHKRCQETAPYRGWRLEIARNRSRSDSDDVHGSARKRARDGFALCRAAAGVKLGAGVKLKKKKTVAGRNASHLYCNAEPTRDLYRRGILACLYHRWRFVSGRPTRVGGSTCYPDGGGRGDDASCR